MNKFNYLGKMQQAFNRLIDIYEEHSTTEIPEVDNGNFEFVANVFFETQAEHLRASKCLLESKRFISIKILGRVMFEGMVHLLWINADRKDRAMKWRAWSAVTDWRLLSEKDAANIPVDDNQRQRVLERVEDVRHLFSRKIPKDGDPFVFSWMPKIKQMLKELPPNAMKLNELYNPIYKVDSQLIHWTVAGLGPLLDRIDDRLEFQVSRESDQINAMNAVFHAAWHVIYNCSRWFGEELDEKLEAISKDYATNCKCLLEARLKNR